MQIEQPRTRWGTLIGISLALLALAIVPFVLFQSKVPLPTYEVQNFVGKVEVYSSQDAAWRSANRGDTLRAGDKIRTSDGGEIDIRVPDLFRLRVKENTEAEVSRPKLLERSLRYRLHILRGNLLGSTQKQFEGQQLDVSTPVLVAAVRGTSFQIEVRPEVEESAVRVLQGSATVQSIRARKSVVVRALEMTKVKGGEAPIAPVRVSWKEWNNLKEAYELIQKSVAQEARQLDLSKHAGSLFQYVFDHGTFFTPNFGHADREFIKDESTGKVHLEVQYDVFPAGSFVGMYMKTRDLDIAKFQAIEFQVRGDPEEGYPDSFKIEFKSGGGIVRAFVPRDYKEKWTTFKFPLRFTRSTLLSEITFVFANEKVGSNKKGSLHIQDVNLEPLAVPLQPAPAKPAAQAQTVSSPKATPAAGTNQES